MMNVESLFTYCKKRTSLLFYFKTVLEIKIILNVKMDGFVFWGKTCGFGRRVCRIMVQILHRAIQ